jgi:hypothetical protein
MMIEIVTTRADGIVGTRRVAVAVSRRGSAANGTPTPRCPDQSLRGAGDKETNPCPAMATSGAG